MSRKHRRKSQFKVDTTGMPKQKLHGVPGFRGPNLVQMECPQCGKRRMVREEGHVVSVMTTISLDNARKRYVDVCDACMERFRREDQEYKDRRVAEAEKALENKEDMKGNTSLEDAL